MNKVYLRRSWHLGCRLNIQFRLGVVLDNVVYLINLLCIEGQECFLDFEDLRCVCSRFGDLSIWYWWFFDFIRLLGFAQGFIILKVLGNDIDLSFWFNWERGQWGNLLYCDQDRFGYLLLLLLGERILRVNLDKILDLSVLDLLSVYNVSQLELYMDDMKFHMESPILSKSDKLLAFEALTFLFLIYLAIKFKESLILLESEAICSIDLWRKIGWKLLFHKSGSVGVFES